MNAPAIYNEIEPYAAEWLENLVGAGHIAPGRVERRGIADLTADDVRGPGQRHFFAGIGGWSYALRLAGVPDDADIWTGSCPCQPFSGAGKRLGARDPRHLWPAWFALIRECRPPVIYGEQVASRDGLQWLDLVRADMEGCGYAIGASDLCAAGVSAPHLRQRLYFVAYANESRFGELGQRWICEDRVAQPRRDVDGCGEAMLGDSLAREWRPQCESARSETRCEPGAASGPGFMAKPAVSGSQRTGGKSLQGRESGPADAGAPGPTFWTDAEWVACDDPSLGIVYRPVEPGTFPLAHGVPNRVGRLRGYGNAIVPQLAAVFIRCAEEARKEAGR